MDVGEEFGRAVRALQAGDLRTAERACGKILRKTPRHLPALALLAGVQFQGGDLDAGIKTVRTLLRFKPDDAEAWFNLGHALSLQQRLDEALESYEKLLALQPAHSRALVNRGAILLLLDRAEEALESFRKAHAAEPAWVAALANIGFALVQLKRHEEALPVFEQALARAPDDEMLLFAKGNLLEELNRADEAVEHFRKILAQHPNLAKARFALCKAQLPVLYKDEAEIATRRAAYARCLEGIAADVDKLVTRTPVQFFELKPPFYLPYQGMNDRDLQSAYGTVACKLMAARFPQQVAKAPRAASRKPLKIGVVSGFFREHSNWKIPIKGWIGGLDRNRFRVFAYHTGQSADEQTAAAKAMAEHFVQGLPSLDAWRQAILADAPDVLIYPEVGMDPVAAQLAALRLAPVQCNSWGHPTTSGFPTLDYFLSSDLMEPDNAQDFYTEKLVRLPNLSIHYEPAEMAAAGAADVGWRPGAVRFWCGQSIPKYLPQYDAVFARIAKEAGDCQFAFVASQVSAPVTEQFRARIAKAFAAERLDAARYCLFLPRMAEREFSAALGQSDVFLDSIGWSGCNSTLESLPYDLPIVTWPGAQMRARHSMAILRMMGVTSTIAASGDAYVTMAVRLARDPAERAGVKAQMAANKHKVYRDRSVVTALEDFLEKAAREG